MNVKKIVLFIVIILVNISTVGSFANMLLTIPQLCIVIYYLLKKEYDKAILWHFIFISLSITATTALVQTSVYNYDGLKLIGPLRFSYVLSIIIYFLTKGRKKEQSLILMKLKKMFYYMAFCGIFVGLLGLLLKDYFIEYFIINSSYIFIIIINLLILINNNSVKLVREFFYNFMLALIASPIATFISYLCGLTTLYGDFSAVVQSEIDFYSVCLLIGIFYLKNKLWILLSLFCLLFNISFSGGGREIIVLGIGLTCFLIKLFSNNSIALHSTSVKTMRIGVVCLAIFLFSAGVVLDDSYLFYHKMNDVLSLFQIFNVKELTELSIYVSQSPYVRIASLINIINDARDNILNIFLGYGYGGYFTDSLGLFSHLHQLEDGGWPSKYVQLGKFPYAHDSFANVPLLNGFLGLYILIKVSFSIYKSKVTNFMSFAVFPFLLISFYFSTTYGIVGLCLIFASQYKLSQNEKNSLC